MAVPLREQFSELAAAGVINNTPAAALDGLSPAEEAKRQAEAREAEIAEDTRADRARDFEELQGESAGREDGRMNRFIGGATTQNPNSRKDDDGADEMMDLLSEQEQQAFARLDNIVSGLRAANNAYISELTKKRDEAKKKLEELQDNAIVLRDGRRVYHDIDGKFYDEDDQVITGRDADFAQKKLEERKEAGVYAPQRAEFKSADTKYVDLETALTEAKEYGKKLDNIEKEREEGKISLEQYKEEVQALQDSTPDQVKQIYEKKEKAMEEARIKAYDKKLDALESKRGSGEISLQQYKEESQKLQDSMPEKVRQAYEQNEVAKNAYNSNKQDISFANSDGKGIANTVSLSQSYAAASSNVQAAAAEQAPSSEVNKGLTENINQQNQKVMPHNLA